MKIRLHLKLEKMITIQRKGPKHWLLKDEKKKHVTIPRTGEVVSVKKALYAAFRGEVPDKHDIRYACDHKYCINPHHQELRYSEHSTSKGLSLPYELGILTRRGTAEDRRNERSVVLPEILPRGLTRAKITAVKFLFKQKNSLEQIRAATGLDNGTIVAINNGKFDQAARNISGLNASQRRARVAAERIGSRGSRSRMTIEEASARQAIADLRDEVKVREAFPVPKPASVIPPEEIAKMSLAERTRFGFADPEIPEPGDQPPGEVVEVAKIVDELPSQDLSDLEEEEEPPGDGMTKEERNWLEQQRRA
jgi:hypothetical protein